MWHLRRDRNIYPPLTHKLASPSSRLDPTRTFRRRQQQKRPPLTDHQPRGRPRGQPPGHTRAAKPDPRRNPPGSARIFEKSEEEELEEALSLESGEKEEEGGEDGKTVNYAYHPIIDFFDRYRWSAS